MGYPTPPPSVRKRKFGLFEAPERKPVYYEDVYGQQDDEEDVGAVPDQCESDSDSDFGNEGGKSKEPPIRRSNRNEGVIAVEARDDGDGAGLFKIAPSVDSRRSLPVKRRRLAPKKFEMPARGSSIEGTASEVSDDESATEKVDKGDQRKNDAKKVDSGEFSMNTSIWDPPVTRSGAMRGKGLVERPDSRTLLKQQLKDHDLGKKKSRKSKGDFKKAGKEAKDMRSKGDFNRTAWVQINNRNIDQKQYARHN